MTSPELTVVRVDQTDPRAQPLLAELAVEYSSRYGGTAEQMYSELVEYPADEFAAPDGALVVIVRDDEVVAGGAFRRYDADTAELKRIWTSAAHRRRGLARRVLVELEREIAELGYRRIYLTTGWRQPEAVALYLAAGYTALYDPSVPAEEIGPHPFEKLIGATR
ncbi:GNAT family N-acetyltransferase [Williamsia sp.]|uniref:GNAT family N-acetyltransferase n=1 Tax=Williamsia sp. TaxID=1872085 RepID=UPI001A2AE3B6|nr:GNAT family N-acetyltransferase [Williamsia sp.]MBJ7291420.1 GNAT family N-acetyltransferase [Williamsia sp.]